MLSPRRPRGGLWRWRLFGRSSKGNLAIASGGGGIPVAERGNHQLRGVEAVIDKDLAAVVLAASLEADGLILLTDVDAVYQDWGKPGARPLLTLTLAEAQRLAGKWFPSRRVDGAQGAGMRPVVCSGGKMAAIGALDDVGRVLRGGGNHGCRRSGYQGPLRKAVDGRSALVDDRSRNARRRCLTQSDLAVARNRT